MSCKTCPMCSRASAFQWFSKFRRTYYRCKSCNHIFVNLDDTMLKQTRDIYTDGTLFVDKGNENYYFDKSNILSMKMKLDWVKKWHRGGGALLDVGANFGHFLKVAQEQFMAQGIEISPYAVEWSKSHLGVNNAVAAIEDLPPGHSGAYDIITLWDVIEHLPQWRRAMSNIVDALKPKGLFFLTTPVSSGPAARLLGKHWYYLDPVQHFHIFSKENLVHILEESGLEILDTRYFGRYYNMKYIFDRLAYLSSSKIFRAANNMIKKAAGLCRDRSIYISLGDVLGVCARKKAIP